MLWRLHKAIPPAAANLLFLQILKLTSGDGMGEIKQDAAYLVPALSFVVGLSTGPEISTLVHWSTRLFQTPLLSSSSSLLTVPIKVSLPPMMITPALAPSHGNGRSAVASASSPNSETCLILSRIGVSPSTPQEDLALPQVRTSTWEG